MYHSPYSVFNVPSFCFTYSVSLNICPCFFLIFTPPGDLDDASSGAESEKSPWPLKTCSTLLQTSPTGWRSHRRPCMLHSPSSWKTLPKSVTKEVLKRFCRLLMSSVSWMMFSILCEKMREINLLVALYLQVIWLCALQQWDAAMCQGQPWHQLSAPTQLEKKAPTLTEQKKRPAG